MESGEAVTQTERALLGSVLLDNSLWPQTDGVSAEDFARDSHRRIYRCMAAMFEDQQPVDEITLSQELEDRNELAAIGGREYISDLDYGVVPENITEHIKSVRQASLERRISRQVELLAKTCEMRSPDKLSDLREQAQRLLDSLDPSSTGNDWRALFHSYDETLNAPSAQFAIDGFLQEEGITLIGGLAGHGKTLCMLAMVRALLEGGKLFHHFEVAKRADRVVYLIPEAGLGPFSARLKTFHLVDHIRDGRLFYQTLSSPKQLSLTDPQLLEAVKGADVFLDTAIRFMVGDENSAAEQKLFADNLFALQRAGARTITGAHHSPKNFSTQNSMTLENVLRGSGDIGAMLTTCWGLSQIDAAKNRIYIQNVKARDFQACEPFIIQGRPSINETGYFELTESPGFAGSLGDNKAQAGRPETPGKEKKQAHARQLKEQGMSYRDIAEALDVKTTTLHRWLKEANF